MKNIVVTAAFTVALVVLCSGSPFAQGFPGRGRDGFPRPGPGFDILRTEPLELSEPVVDVPFSADTITEMVQLLADGNRIEQQTKGSIARDSRGRIRSEQTLAGLGPATGGEGFRMVTITDPTRREQYRLDEMRKIAWKMQLPPPRPPRREGSGIGLAPPPKQSLKTEQLNAMLFDGVKADGTRAVLVFPPRTIGNERAIEVVSERWYAPELRVVVATKRIDPRFGDTSYRLVNIVRAEPPDHLFEVPADFTVRDQPAFPPPR